MKNKNLKDFNTIFYPKTHILIKFLIQASFIKKRFFWCYSELFKKAFWRSRSYPNVKEPRESKMIGNKSKKKRNEMAIEDKDDDWDQSGKEREWWLRIK